MRRTLAIGFGLIEALAQEQLIAIAERLAFENPEDGRLRPWTIPVGRLEGVVFAWLVGRDEGPPPAATKLLAATGLVMALFPRTVVELSLRLAYENADDLELRPWIVPATRLLGACYAAVGLFSRPVDAPADDTVESPPTRQ